MIGGRLQDDDAAASRDWAPPSPVAPTKREAPAITTGDTVLHEKWGEGVVLTVSGSGDGTEATIAFSEVGEKRVLLAYAPLRKAG